MSLIDNRAFSFYAYAINILKTFFSQYQKILMLTLFSVPISILILPEAKETIIRIIFCMSTSLIKNKLLKFNNFYTDIPSTFKLEIRLN